MGGGIPQSDDLKSSGGNPSPIPVITTTFFCKLATSEECVRVRILTPNDPMGIRIPDSY
jgi:hypothetical protein